MTTKAKAASGVTAPSAAQTSKATHKQDTPSVKPKPRMPVFRECPECGDYLSSRELEFAGRVGGRIKGKASQLGPVVLRCSNCEFKGQTSEFRKADPGELAGILDCEDCEIGDAWWGEDWPRWCSDCAPDHGYEEARAYQTQPPKP